MKQWFTAQTHIRSEIKAAFHLKRQGFETYIPQYLKLRRHARKRDMVKSPLFPRYIFIAFDIHREHWRSINSTIGISQIICHGDKPAVLADKLINEIRAREDEKGNVSINKIIPFSPGQAVQIIKGALVDQMGIFECSSGEERVKILLNLLGRPMKVEIPLESISAPT